MMSNFVTIDSSTGADVGYFAGGVNSHMLMQIVPRIIANTNKKGFLGCSSTIVISSWDMPHKPPIRIMDQFTTILYISHKSPMNAFDRLHTAKYYGRFMGNTNPMMR
jgi:hypothetical protein